MYPPNFDYQAPDTLEGALASLAELGDEGTSSGGGAKPHPHDEAPPGNALPSGRHQQDREPFVCET